MRWKPWQCRNGAAARSVPDSRTVGAHNGVAALHDVTRVERVEQLLVAGHQISLAPQSCDCRVLHDATGVFQSLPFTFQTRGDGFVEPKACCPQLLLHVSTVGYEQLGRVAGRAGALIRRQLSQTPVDLVADCHQCRHAAGSNGARHLFGAERVQIFGAATATDNHDNLRQLGHLVEVLNGRYDLLRCGLDLILDVAVLPTLARRMRAE